MSTKDDFVSYFSDLERTEKEMHDLYLELKKKISDTQIAKVLTGLARAKENQVERIEDLRQVLLGRSIAA